MALERTKRSAVLSDVLSKWCEMTCTPEISLDRRMRELRAESYLPSLAGRSTDKLIADFIIGILFVSTPIGVAPEAQYLRDATFLYSQGPLIDKRFAGADFGVSLAAMIRLIRKGAPLRLYSVAAWASPAGDAGGCVEGSFGGEDFKITWLSRSEDGPVASGFPIVSQQTVAGEVIHALAALGSDRDKNPALSKKIEDIIKDC